MAKTIVTVQATAYDTLTAAKRRHVTTAFKALAALEPSPTRIRRAAVAVGALRNDGFSIRGTVAILSVAGQGTLPTGKGTIERLGYVADAIAGDWPDVGDNADGILMALYRIAQTGKAADVAHAAELGRKSSDGNAAYIAVDAVKAELNAAEHKSLTTPPAREVAGEAADGGKQSDADSDADEPSDSEPSEGKRTATDVSRELGRYTLSSLLAEVARRVAVDNFYADAALIELFDAVADGFTTAAMREVDALTL